LVQSIPTIVSTIILSGCCQSNVPSTHLMVKGSAADMSLPCGSPLPNPPTVTAVFDCDSKSSQVLTPTVTETAVSFFLPQNLI
jgi:hypothetical protein